MDTILESKSSIMTTESPNRSVPFRAESEPIAAETSVVMIKQQISAPSYFHSLKENDAPPFRRPGIIPRPKIIIGTILNEGEVIQMIAAADANKENGLTNFLGQMLVHKKIIQNYDLSERKFLISLLKETIDYAAQRDFNAAKLALLMTIYLDTHIYFKSYYWHTPTNIWNYFKEIMIRHSIEDSPTGQEMFEPYESYDIITHFHTIYFTNLPLIHVLTFGAYKLKVVWPFKRALK